MKKIKMILFDIDNTLIYGGDTLRYYYQYPRLLEKTLSIALDVPLARAVEIANDHRARYNGSGEKSFETYNIADVIWYDAICTLDPNVGISEMIQTQAVLNTLKSQGYILGAITDGPTAQAHKLLKAAGIDESLFSLFVGWDRGGTMPKGGRQDIYKKILSEYDYDASEILMVGDSLFADIMPAHACGLEVVHICPTADSGYPTTASIEELLPYLNNNEQNN